MSQFNIVASLRALSARSRISLPSAHLSWDSALRCCVYGRDIIRRRGRPCDYFAVLQSLARRLFSFYFWVSCFTWGILVFEPLYWFICDPPSLIWIGRSACSQIIVFGATPWSFLIRNIFFFLDISDEPEMLFMRCFSSYGPSSWRHKSRPSIASHIAVDTSKIQRYQLGNRTYYLQGFSWQACTDLQRSLYPGGELSLGNMVYSKNECDWRETG